MCIGARNRRLFLAYWARASHFNKVLAAQPDMGAGALQACASARTTGACSWRTWARASHFNKVLAAQPDMGAGALQACASARATGACSWRTWARASHFNKVLAAQPDIGAGALQACASARATGACSWRTGRGPRISIKYWPHNLTWEQARCRRVHRRAQPAPVPGVLGAGVAFQ